METTTTYKDSEATNSENNKLGKCEVCNTKDAKYTCPKCEVKTCCLDCLKIHKKELNCDGIRDKTKYIPLKKMTQMDFMSDYHFLEECTRYVADRKRDKIKKYTIYNKELPTHLFRLRAACKQRNTTLRFLLSNFTKHRINTTKLDFKKQIINWKVEWNFPNVGDKVLTFFDDDCGENETIGVLLEKYLDESSDIVGKKQLEYYQAKGIDALRILLKAEGVRKSKNRYYELDYKLNLKENLAGKTIVEFPVIAVVFDEVAQELDIIHSDDEDEVEKRRYDQIIGNCSNMSVKRSNSEATTDSSKKKRVEKNFLFSNEASSSEADDDGATTEEEKDL